MATTRTIAWTTGRSLLATESTSNLPTPGNPNTDSVMTTPPTSSARLSATTLTTGRLALGTMCRHMVRLGDSPFRIALRTNGCELVSRTLARTIRAIYGVSTTPKVRIGSAYANGTSSPVPKAAALDSTGSTGSLTANTSSRAIPTTNSGRELTNSATSDSPTSGGR